MDLQRYGLNFRKFRSYKKKKERKKKLQETGWQIKKQKMGLLWGIGKYGNRSITYCWASYLSMCSSRRNIILPQQAKFRICGLTDLMLVSKLTGHHASFSMELKKEKKKKEEETFKKNGWHKNCNLNNGS